MITPAYVKLMTRYNRAMNESVYAACSKLSEDELKADRGAFFRSIHGTLNHLLWADARTVAAYTGEALPPADTRTEMHASFVALAEHRAQVDAALERFASAITQDALDATRTQTSVATGRSRTWPLGALLVHLFNHQTHHRGQVSTLLSQAGVDIGITDLPWLDIDYGF